MFFSLTAVEGLNVFKGCNCKERSVMLGITPLLADEPSVFPPACSLGVVLSRGHGEYILLGNTSVEEGRLIWNSHAVPRELEATLHFAASLHPHSLYLPACYLPEYSAYYLVSGLHDLLQPDLSLANEW